jgi:hypothetical protein
MSPEPDGTPPLQFETALVAGRPATTEAPDGVTCRICQRSIINQYFDVNGLPVCEACREQLAEHGETPRGLGVMTRAALFGVGAAIAGAILYFAVVELTGLEIGIAAIAIGYMVGYAIRRGARGRGGRRFQIIAVVLTYWAVGLAYTPMVFKAVRADVKKRATGEAGAQPASAQPAPPPAATAPPAAADRPAAPGALRLLLALGILLAFSLALPVLMVVGSLPGGLISGAIIAFGMRQAWTMTGAPHLVITGPYAIAPPLSAG